MGNRQECKFKNYIVKHNKRRRKVISGQTSFQTTVHFQRNIDTASFQYRRFRPTFKIQRRHILILRIDGRIDESSD